MNNWKIFIIAAMTLIFVACNQTGKNETTEEATVPDDNPALTDTSKDMNAEEGATAGKNVIYTCPMHPEVQQDKPGKCPKCGMTLEVKK